MLVRAIKKLLKQITGSYHQIGSGDLKSSSLRNIRNACVGDTIFSAIKDNDTAMAEQLLTQDINLLTRRSKDGMPPLHVAVYNNRKSMVEFMIAKGAYINATARNGLSALHIASKYGYKEIAEILIVKGANVNAVTMTNWSPLHTAVLAGHEEIAKYLIDNGADVNTHLNSTLNEIICIAISEEKPAWHFSYLSSASDFFGWTPLHLAVLVGKTNLIKYLIDKGADINTRVRRKHNDIMRSPLDFDLGPTPLQLAQEMGTANQELHLFGMESTADEAVNLIEAFGFRNQGICDKCGEKLQTFQGLMAGTGDVLGNYLSTRPFPCSQCDKIYCGECAVSQKWKCFHCGGKIAE